MSGVRRSHSSHTPPRSTSGVLHQLLPPAGLPNAPELRDPTPTRRRPTDRACRRRAGSPPPAGRRRSGRKPKNVRPQDGVALRGVRPTSPGSSRPRRRLRIRRRRRLLLLPPAHGERSTGTSDDLPVAKQPQELHRPAGRQDSRASSVRREHSRRPAASTPAPHASVAALMHRDNVRTSIRTASGRRLDQTRPPHETDRDGRRMPTQPPKAPVRSWRSANRRTRPGNRPSTSVPTAQIPSAAQIG